VSDGTAGGLCTRLGLNRKRLAKAAAPSEYHEVMPSASSPPRPRSATNYLAAAAVVAACTALSGLIHTWHLREANILMIYLAGVALTAARFGHGAALAAIGLSAVSYNYFFVPPIFAFAKVEPQYVITLGVMVAIGLLISELTSRLRAQLHESRLQERRNELLYRMTREFGSAADAGQLWSAAGEVAADAFDGEVALYLRDGDGHLVLRVGEETALTGGVEFESAAKRAATSQQLTGRGTGELPELAATLAPMLGPSGLVGVLAVRPRNPERFLDEEERQMLQACAKLVALSLERERSSAQAHRAQAQVETEQLRNSLLTSISHDLRTPLATIAVTTSALLEEAADQTPAQRREVLQTIVEETRQLGRQIDNMLDMGRLNAGGAVMAGEWHVLEELVGVALARLRRELAGHQVAIELPGDLPLVWATGDLLVQVLVNLLENAARYTPAGSRIEIRARRRSLRMEVTIADNGPGLPPGSEASVFGKFVRGPTTVADGRRGMGLGLAICRHIVLAHEGDIVARNRPEGGAEFVMMLRCEERMAPAGSKSDASPQPAVNIAER
jgi:two-component system sensor histidine kinase KdpD